MRPKPALKHIRDNSIRIIDSHTGGEPTRVIIGGAPAPIYDSSSAGHTVSVAERLAIMRREFDWLRSSVVNEPRGSDVLVGALLCEPISADSAAGVIFFNNVSYLGMCGHGTIGLAVTLAHLGRMDVGEHKLETPAGDVVVKLLDSHTASVNNVASYRYRQDFELEVPQIGTVRGDIAWGGNWFFLVSEHGQALGYEDADNLTEYAWAIRRELDSQGVRGPGDELIDHVELFGPPSDPGVADSRNFVLCPGKAYDRSPCGTGTSAKVACLIEDGKLAAGETWRQESITGSIFEASGDIRDGSIYPTITGTAYVTGEATLMFDPSDPFRYGLGTSTATRSHSGD
jgi:4-hydroxyproline epimerase